MASWFGLVSVTRGQRDPPMDPGGGRERWDGRPRQEKQRQQAKGKILSLLNRLVECEIIQYNTI